MEKWRFSQTFRAISSFILVAFCLNSIGPIPHARAQAIPLTLPAPNTLLPLSPSYNPLVIRGIKLFKDNPLKFDFIVDPADSKLKGEALKEESTKLIKYFLATLTTPKEDLWVNLSPYEKDRIIPKAFGTTEMGRDLLGEDYILKQLTSSLMYPEHELGKKFWDEIYKKAYEKYGVTNIPVDTFNKVWILPDKAVVYENGDTAFVTESHLKVMLEEDLKVVHSSEFIVYGKNISINEESNIDNPPSTINHELSTNISNIIREIILPAIEKEVNEGEHFAKLRQIYNSMILATWFKRNLEKNILGEIYVGKNKVDGVDIADKTEKEKIYQQYLEAFKTGAYNYVKDEYDPNTQEIIPRKYFSGGVVLDVDKALTVKNKESDPESGNNFIKKYKYLVGTALVVGVLLTANLLNRKSIDLPKSPAISSQSSSVIQLSENNVPHTFADWHSPFQVTPEDISGIYFWDQSTQDSMVTYSRNIGDLRSMPLRERVKKIYDYMRHSSPEGLGIVYSGELAQVNALKEQPGNQLDAVIKGKKAICKGFSSFVFFAANLNGIHTHMFSVFNRAASDKNPKWDHAATLSFDDDLNAETQLAVWGDGSFTGDQESLTSDEFVFSKVYRYVGGENEYIMREDAPEIQFYGGNIKLNSEDNRKNMNVYRRIKLSFPHNEPKIFNALKTQDELLLKMAAAGDSLNAAGQSRRAAQIFSKVAEGYDSLYKTIDSQISLKEFMINGVYERTRKRFERNRERALKRIEAVSKMAPQDSNVLIKEKSVVTPDKSISVKTLAASALIAGSLNVDLAKSQTVNPAKYELQVVRPAKEGEEIGPYVEFLSAFMAYIGDEKFDTLTSRLASIGISLNEAFTFAEITYGSEILLSKSYSDIELIRHSLESVYLAGGTNNFYIYYGFMHDAGLYQQIYSHPEFLESTVDLYKQFKDMKSIQEIHEHYGIEKLRTLDFKSYIRLMAALNLSGLPYVDEMETIFGRGYINRLLKDDLDSYLELLLHQAQYHHLINKQFPNLEDHMGLMAGDYDVWADSLLRVLPSLDTMSNEIPYGVYDHLALRQDTTDFDAIRAALLNVYVQSSLPVFPGAREYPTSEQLQFLFFQVKALTEMVSSSIYGSDDNANSDFKFTRTMVKGHSKANLLFTIGHEIGHNMLFFGKRMLKRDARELYADISGAAFVQSLGMDYEAPVEEYFKSSVNLYNTFFKLIPSNDDTLGQHTRARLQWKWVVDSLKARNIFLDYQRMNKAANDMIFKESGAVDITLGEFTFNLLYRYFDMRHISFPDGFKKIEFENDMLMPEEIGRLLDVVDKALLDDGLPGSSKPMFPWQKNEFYNELSHTFPGYNENINTLLNHLKDRFDLSQFKKNVVVFGFGGNPGELIRAAEEFPNAQIIGVEWVPAQVNFVQQQIDANPKVRDRIKIHLGDIADLKDPQGQRIIPNDSVDVVLSSMVFKMYEDQSDDLEHTKQVITEIYRMLRPEGLMISGFEETKTDAHLQTLAGLKRLNKNDDPFMIYQKTYTPKNQKTVDHAILTSDKAQASMEKVAAVKVLNSRDIGGRDEIIDTLKNWNETGKRKFANNADGWEYRVRTDLQGPSQVFLYYAGDQFEPKAIAYLYKKNSTKREIHLIVIETAEDVKGEGLGGDLMNQIVQDLGKDNNIYLVTRYAGDGWKDKDKGEEYLHNFYTDPRFGFKQLSEKSDQYVRYADKAQINESRDPEQIFDIISNFISTGERKLFKFRYEWKTVIDQIVKDFGGRVFLNYVGDEKNPQAIVLFYQEDMKKNEIYLRAVETSLEKQGEGLSRALIEKVVADFGKKYSLRLEVSYRGDIKDGQDILIKFYEKLGFKLNPNNPNEMVRDADKAQVNRDQILKEVSENFKIIEKEVSAFSRKMELWAKKNIPNRRYNSETLAKINFRHLVGLQKSRSFKEVEGLENEEFRVISIMEQLLDLQLLTEGKRNKLVMHFVRNILQEVDMKIIPPLKRIKGKFFVTLPNADDWLAYSVMEYYPPDYEGLLADRIKVMTQYSREASAVYLAYIGYHLRGTIYISDVDMDIRKILPELLQSAINGKMTEDYAEIIISGLLFSRLPAETKYGDIFKELENKVSGLREIIIQIFADYPQLKKLQNNYLTYEEHSTADRQIALLSNSKNPIPIWDSITDLKTVGQTLLLQRGSESYNSVKSNLEFLANLKVDKARLGKTDKDTVRVWEALDNETPIIDESSQYGIRLYFLKQEIHVYIHQGPDIFVSNLGRNHIPYPQYEFSGLEEEAGKEIIIQDSDEELLGSKVRNLLSRLRSNKGINEFMNEWEQNDAEEMRMAELKKKYTKEVVTDDKERTVIIDKLNPLLDLDIEKLTSEQVDKIQQSVAALGFEPFYTAEKFHPDRWPEHPMDQNIYKIKQGDIVYIQYGIRGGDNKEEVITETEGYLQEVPEFSPSAKMTDGRVVNLNNVTEIIVDQGKGGHYKGSNGGVDPHHFLTGGHLQRQSIVGELPKNAAIERGNRLNGWVLWLGINKNLPIKFVTRQYVNKKDAWVRMTGEKVTVMQTPGTQNNGVFLYKKADGSLGDHDMVDINRIYILGTDDKTAQLDNHQFKENDRVVILSGDQMHEGIVERFYSAPFQGRRMIVKLDNPTDASKPYVHVKFVNDVEAVVIGAKNSVSKNLVKTAFKNIHEIINSKLIVNSDEDIVEFGERFRILYEKISEKLSGNEDLDISRLSELFEITFGVTFDGFFNAIVDQQSYKTQTEIMVKVSKLLNTSERRDVAGAYQQLLAAAKVFAGANPASTGTIPWTVREKDYLDIMQDNPIKSDFTFMGLLRYFSKDKDEFEDRLRLAFKIASAKESRMEDHLNKLYKDRDKLVNLTLAAADIAIEEYTKGLTNTEDKEVIKFVLKGDKSIQNKSVGGIDLNPDNLKIETKGRMMEFNLPPELEYLRTTPINGFTPVIIQMTPVNNLPLLLGLEERNKKQELTMANSSG